MTQTPGDQFAAALAHQLKTPASALQSAASNIRRNLRGLLEDLATMAGDGAAGAAIMRFVSRVVSEPAPPPMTGLMPEARLDAIARRLADAGLGGDLVSVSAALVRGGWDTYLEEIVPLLRADLALTLDVLETTARLRANMASVEMSLNRIRGISGALRLLARSVEGCNADLGQSIQTAVQLLNETLPSGVLVVMRLETASLVSGHTELLCEVWTNLVVNAVQSVGEKGTISIETSPGADGSTVVRVIDDGPGIRKDLLARVFEPYFTTRSVDGGTGLGLALTRQIVEKLGGTISVESRPGRTCFEVSLLKARSVVTGAATRRVEG
ncbi:MAG TPA: ATP-binding protein [Patescibacteria group bacterium]|jgi:signal transduction histidine kinase|nr:ATP-binding protein [Patescibacteria group bacterium]